MDRRRSRFHHPVIITDTDLADNIAITTGEIHQAQEMLVSVEIEAAIIELHLKGAMSPHTHARANENKLEKDSPTFSSCVGDFGRLFLSV